VEKQYKKLSAAAVTAVPEAAATTLSEDERDMAATE